MKHFKIQLLFNNPKKYSSCDQYPKKYRLSKFKTPKILHWFLGLFDAWLFVANYTKLGKFVGKLEKI